MKKVFILALVVIMLFSMSGCITVVDGVPQEDYDALKEAYDELKAAYDSLLEEDETPGTSDGVDITTIRGIAYELLFDMVYYKFLLEESYDFDTSVENVIEQFDLDEQEEAELGIMLNTLIERYFPENESPEEPTEKFDEETVLSQLEVTEYSYSTNYSRYAFLVIKNNSNYDLDISATANFYNEAGELVNVKTSSEPLFSSGSEIILYFMPDEKYTEMEYEFAIEEEDWYESVVHELSYESTPAKNKEILSVTNNGNEAADFVKAYALFFNGDSVVGFGHCFFTDDDFELKPGETMTKELDCFKEYTSVRFFLTGRR